MMYLKTTYLDQPMVSLCTVSVRPNCLCVSKDRLFKLIFQDNLLATVVSYRISTQTSHAGEYRMIVIVLPLLTLISVVFIMLMLCYERAKDVYILATSGLSNKTATNIV